MLDANLHARLADWADLLLVLPLDAVTLADERGLDLIEVSPNASPPVCKIGDYGQLKYERKKREAAAVVAAEVAAEVAAKVAADSSINNDEQPSATMNKYEQRLTNIN